MRLDVSTVIVPPQIYSVEPFLFQTEHYVSVRDGLKLDVRLVTPCHVFFPLYVRGA